MSVMSFGGRIETWVSVTRATLLSCTLFCLALKQPRKYIQTADYRQRVCVSSLTQLGILCLSATSNIGMTSNAGQCGNKTQNK